MPADQKNLAVMIAVLLDRDPHLATEVKKHISDARLVELFDLREFKPQPVETPGQMRLNDLR